MIEETLSSMGLTGYETKIYIALVEFGRLNAQDIAKNSKVPITAVYPNLKSLVGKGLVQKIEGEVGYYLAKDIKTAIRSFIKNRAQELEKFGENVVSELESIKRKKQIAKEPEIIDVSVGGPASTQLTLKLADETKKSLHILGWRFSTMRSAYLLLNKFSELIKNGKDVRIIVTKKGKCYDKLIDAYVNAGIKIKYYQTGDFAITIKDEEECKLAIKGPELPDRISLYIQNKDLSKSMEDYFLNIWKKAREKIYF